MKKKLLMAAVGAALIAGPVLSAHAGTTLYGRLNVGIASVDNGNSTNNDTVGVSDDASRLGVKGDEDLGGGLKAIYNMELVYDGDGSGGVSGAGRDVFVGLTGGWGTVRVGQYNSAYKNTSTGLEILGDTIGDFTHSTMQGETRIANAIGYESPNFNGFSFAAQSARGEAGGSSEANPLILAASYKAGPLYVGVARVDNDLPAGAAATAIEDSIKIAASYTFNDFTLFAVHDDASAVSSTNDLQTVHFGGSYKMGNNIFALTFTDYKVEGANNDADQTSAGVIHLLSKSTKLMFVYTKLDNEPSATRSGRILSSAGLADGGLAGPTAGNDPSGLQAMMSISF
jgi:predicted porin